MTDDDHDNVSDDDAKVNTSGKDAAVNTESGDVPPPEPPWPPFNYGELDGDIYAW